MRIRYSIVIPGVFILFCMLFSGLIYLTIKEQEQAEDQYEKDQKTLYFIEQEVKKINENLSLILTELDQEDFEAAFDLHSDIMMRIDNIKEIGTGLSEGSRKRLYENYIKPKTDTLNALKEHLSKGDINGSKRIVKNILQKNN